MRNLIRKSRETDEEESAFISMTDMTVSFLFIVILLMAFFSSRYSENRELVPKEKYEQSIAENAELKNEKAQMQALIRSHEWAFEWWRKWVVDLENKIALLKINIEERDNVIALLSQKNPLEEYLSRSAAARKGVLVELKSLLQKDFPKLMIEISAESDALRFQGEGLFRTGESQLMEEKRPVVAALARRLDQLLPDYTFDKAGRAMWNESRNPDFALIEAVQIEGHTDSEGDDMSNLHLSTARANSTFVAMLEAALRITAYTNYKKQPVLSVAGYGEMRPVASNDKAIGRATNRRIDLRIIMHTPASIADVELIKRRLKGGEGLE